MTKQYTNLDKVELSRSFPDIVAIKESAIDGKNLPRAHNQGHTIKGTQSRAHRTILKLWIYACYMIDYCRQMNKFAGVV